MNESTDKSQNINVGGNFNINANQSVVNLRDIIGDVTHTINQIPESQSPQTDELKTLLQNLTTAIQSALQVKAKKAVNLLETIAKGLEPASKLFQVSQTALPVILQFLGL